MYKGVRRRSLGLAIALPLTAIPLLGGDDLKIGVIGAFSALDSGSEATVYAGLPMLKGIVLALDETGGPSRDKAGYEYGIAKIDYNFDENVSHSNLVMNDSSDPRLTERAVDELIGENVVAIIGSVNSDCTLAMMKKCQQHKIPCITAVSTASKALRSAMQRNDPWFFRVAVPDDVSLNLIGEELREQGFERIGVFFEDSWIDASGKEQASVYGRGLLTDFEDTGRSLGLVIRSYPFTRQKRFGTIAESVRHAINEIKQDRSLQAIGLLGLSGDAISIAISLREQGIALPLFGGMGLATGEYARKGDQQTLVFSTFLHSEKRLSALRFTEAYLERFGGETPDSYAAQGYDSIRVIADGLRRMDKGLLKEPGGRTDISELRSKLRDALLETNLLTAVSGPIRFQGAGREHPGETDFDVARGRVVLYHASDFHDGGKFPRGA